MPSVTANPDVYLVKPNVQFNGASVLANDSNTNNFDMNAWINSPTTNGSATLSFNGTFEYTHNAGFTGLDKFQYAVWANPDPDMGVAWAYLIVGEIPDPFGGNRPPIIAQMPAQTNPEGRYMAGVPVIAADPDGDVITYAALQLPDGLSIDPSTGVITGTPTYTCARSYNVTITVTDSLGASANMSFTWNIGDATIGTLKGIEMNNGTAVPNSVTVSGVVNTTIWLSPGNTLQLQVTAPAGGDLPLWEDTLFTTVGGGPTPSSGNFSGQSWPNLSLTNNGTFVVWAGADLNRDATLQNTEVTQQFVVRVVNFDGAIVGSQRVAGGSGPVEPGLTSIKTNEHFEVGGNFKFEIMGDVGSGGNSMIRHQVWGTVQGLIASGWGVSFTHVFQSPVYNALLCFYVDKNNNGSRDLGEAYFNSPYFQVKQIRVFNIVADVSSAIPVPALPAEPLDVKLAGPRQTPTVFEMANNLLLRKDSESDWRSAVQFNVTITNFTATPAGGARPDPVVNLAEEYAKHYSAASHVVFVNQLYPETLFGITSGSAYFWRSWDEIIIGYQKHVDPAQGTLNEALVAGTIAHEFGHGVGLDHPSPDDNTNNHRVMTSVSTGTFDHLTQSEASIYDGGTGLALAELRRNDLGVLPLTQGQLETVLAGASSRLPAIASTAFDFSDVHFAIVDLPGSLLGLTSGNAVWIDQDAAGHGWFIDATPREDSEFPVAFGQHEIRATYSGSAFGKADLLTVLFHEMGHVNGLEHGPDHEVMAPMLPLGTRRLPETEAIHRETSLDEPAIAFEAPAGPAQFPWLSAGFEVPKPILSIFWALPDVSTAVWQSTLFDDGASVSPARGNVASIFDQIWTRRPYLYACKDQCAMNEGLFDNPEGDPWNS